MGLNILYKVLLGCILCIFTCVDGAAQNTSPDIGLPYFTTFLDKDHGGRQQSYDIAFDKRGIAYIGNSSGVLEYDGSRWNSISINATRHIYSLNYDKKQDRIYVGGHSELGYFDANPQRKKEYKSLLPLVDPDKREFTNIEHVLSNGEYTFFLASERVYVFDGTSIHSFEPESFEKNRSSQNGAPYFKYLFLVDNKPFLVHSSEGVLKWETSAFNKIDQDSFFDRIDDIQFIKHYQSNTFLLGTENGNLYTFNKAFENFKPLKTEADPYLKEHNLTNGTVLNDGSIGLTTLAGGFVIVNKHGKWIQLLNKSADLPANYVIAAQQSPTGAIWLAMNSGITRIEWPPVISIIDDRLTNFEDVSSVTRLNDKLYVGTTSGLYKKITPIIDALKSRTSSFEKMIDSTYSVHYIRTVKGQLSIPSNKGLFLYDPDTNQKKTILSSPTFLLFQAGEDPNLFHVVFPDRYIQLKYSESTQTLEKNGPAYTFGEILHEIVIGNREIWYIAGQTIFRQDLESNGIANSFTKFPQNNGLPKEGQYGGALFDGHFTVGTTKGAYRYMESEQQFVPDSKVDKLIGKNNQFYGYRQIDENSFWIGYENDHDNSIALIQKNDQDEYVSQFAPFNRITQTLDSFTYADPLDSAITWLGTVEGLLQYNDRLHHQKNYEAGKAIIREVRTIQNDSLMLSNVSTRSKVVELPSDQRAMRFLFALPGNDAQKLTKYRYYLEGFDQDWSVWTNETQKDYTNIPPGEYTFQVEAQNVYGMTSKIASFQFEIATPLHQSTMAYLLYIAFVMGGLAYVAVWYSNYRTEQQAIRMRAEQTEELAKLDRMKTNLLTNISHELRTPLTLVLGPIEQLRTKASDLGENWKHKLDIAQRNGKRLHQLVEQVLDLTRLDSHQLELNPKNIELTAFLRRLAESFESMAERQGVTIETNLPDENISLQADPDKLEKAMVNLLSNAIKFTPKDGIVRVTLEQDTDEIKISVHDTGRGIAAERLPQIFDRFHSTSEDISGGGKGLGVGLAITKEFIELHDGDISVESEEGAGTIFTIRLPQNAHKRELDDYAINEISLEETEHLEPQLYQENGTTPGNSPYTVLVVEDNDDMRTYIADLLADKDMLVETASNGLEAQKRLSIVGPDLIISDIMMPEIDGFSFAKHVRSIPTFRLTPIVLLSARTEVEDRIQGYEIGVSDYLAKPFDEAELKARVRNLLRLKNERDKHSDQEEQNEHQDKKSVLLKTLQTYVENNLSESKITVEQLSEKANLSRRQLYRKLKAETGCTPAEFIREIRLYNARDLLEYNRNQTVSEVAYAVGFSTPSYFSKLFKERFGRSPKEYGK